MVEPKHFLGAFVICSLETWFLGQFLARAQVIKHLFASKGMGALVCLKCSAQVFKSTFPTSDTCRVAFLYHNEDNVERKVEKEAEVTLRVEDVMVKEVVKIDANVTIKEAACMMNKFEIGCLIAIGNGRVSGILTERDLLKRVVAEGKDASKIRVRDVMSSPLVVAEPKMDLGEAVKLMFHMKIKKLPVVEGKRLVGLLSLTDIARFQPQMLVLIKQLAADHATPQSMQKVINHYVV